MKKLLLIGLIIGVLVLGGCPSNNDGPGAEDTYLGGSQGLEINFAPGAPPETVADKGGEQQFDILVELDNKGEHKVGVDEAEVKIIGFPAESFGVTQDFLTQRNDEEIERRIKNPDGSIIEPPQYQLIYEGLEYQYVQPGNIALPIIAELCYLYETDVATSLCILEDLNSNDDDDVCIVNKLRDISSSGAPVQITKVQESTAGKDKVRFTFTVQNVGAGRIYKMSNSCESKISYENKVWVEIEDIEDRNVGSLKCVGLTEGGDSSGYVTLSSGEPRDISCTLTISDKSDRIQPFNINLKYDYYENVRTAIIIEYTPDE